MSALQSEEQTEHSEDTAGFEIWLREIAVSQLPTLLACETTTIDKISDRNTAAIHLLVVICLKQNNITVMQVLPENVGVCKEEWRGWIESSDELKAALLHLL